MQGKFWGFIVTGAIILVVVAIAARVGFLRKLVFNQSA